MSLLRVFFAVVCVLSSAVIAQGSGIYTKAEVLEAINQVEASGLKENVPPGDGGRALGPLQIHWAYWKDSWDHDQNCPHGVNHGAFPGEYIGVELWDYACKVFDAYMCRYAGYNVWTDTMDIDDVEIVAKIHNGGPNGPARDSTEPYWQLVKAQLPNKD